jgi:hypothetical protein
MRTFQVSEELYDQLKSFVIDPFDDTPDVVIGRLIDIVKKARNHWSPFAECETPQKDPRPAEVPQEQPVEETREQEVFL